MNESEQPANSGKLVSERPKQVDDEDNLEELHIDEKEEQLIHWLHIIIRFCVRLLAVLMTFVIIMTVVDVIWVLYQKLLIEPVGILDGDQILVTFGAFMAGLIAIEIFVNIVLYLRDDVLHVKLVLATALMAVARKVIVFDYKIIDAYQVAATAAIVLALSIAYWLVAKKP